MYRVKQIAAALCLCVLTVFGTVSPAVAGPQQSNSTNYGVSEVNFGSGGQLRACGTAFCADQSAGELVAGTSSSTNYTARGGGKITEREEFLEMIVTGGGLNLGNLDSSTVKFGSLTFSVRSFPAEGYSVVVDGYAPRLTNGSSIAAMSTAATSVPGTEQFGVNLRANSTPSIGADPAHVPDGTFAFGAAGTGYSTVNNYKFVPGEIIASSPKGYGQTNFTLSTITNISTNTKAGAYTARVDLIAVPTF